MRMNWGVVPAGKADLVLAVSGGADSVFLARAVLMRAADRGWDVVLAHVNHGVRGEEADADQAFVEAMARGLGVECVSMRLEPGQIESVGEEDAEAAGAGTSLEGRLRLARWGVLAALAKARRSDAIVTGHHRDDLAETFLLQALRGAGLTGLGSLTPRGEWDEVAILRPMLGIGREEIRAALRDDGIEWREDRTNLDPAFKRNFLRTEVLARIESYQPGSLASLARTARICAEESAELQRQGEEWMQRSLPEEEAVEPCPAGAIEWARLREAPAVLRRHALRAWTRAVRGVSLSPSSEAILDLETAAENARTSGGERFVVSIPGCIVWTDGRWLILGPSCDHAGLARSELLERVTSWFVAWRRLWGIPVLFRESALRASGNELPFENAAESFPLTDRLEVQTSGIENLPDGWRESWREWMEAGRVAVFDADQLKGGARLRRCGTDDRLEMEGGGRKEAMQALAEAGVPEALRTRIPVLADDDGILWLVGVRRAARAFVTPDTRHVLLARAPEKAHVRPPMQ